MNLYAESSAVLAWLLKENAEATIYDLLASADTVTACDLTLIECDRTIWRSAALGSLDEGDVDVVRNRLASVAQHWTVLPFSSEIVERARWRFPHEPIRTLDALHVASALHARLAFPDLAMLSLDERVRRVARSLGLPVIPS
jgi:predicted nucleic acid-binding protein